jgi:HPt (histidine-containing phosphotransfer) domain-containing protein
MDLDQLRKSLEAAPRERRGVSSLEDRKEPTDSEAVLDPALWERLAALDGGRGEIRATLVDVFLRRASELRQEIEEAARASLPKLVARSVHSLKGSAANLGGLHLARTCQEVEKALAAGREAALEPLFQDLATFEKALKAARPRRSEAG